MKRIFLLVALCLLGPALAFAQTNELADLVRKGLFEEEANHNLDAAIQAYQSAIDGFDHNRQLAATAIFRLGECYRKLGRTNDANAQFARILREFPDQSELAKLSHSYLPQNQIPASAPASDSDMTTEERNELLRIQQLIHTSPDLINGGYGLGDTPLVVAIRNNWLHVVRALLDSGADPNHPTYEGWKPVCKAADSGNEKTVEILLDHGADVNGRNTSGKTALFYAARDGFLAIERLLLAHHADPNLADLNNQGANDDPNWAGASPLHVAAMTGDPRVAEMLITNGANLNALDPNGETPFFRAVKGGNPETAKLFLAHGADVNATNKFGNTPLFDAVANSEIPMAQFLLSNGATVNLRGANDAIPLQLAKTDEMRQLLLKFGASDDFQRLGGIYIREKGSPGLGDIVFTKSPTSADAAEPHSLFEILALYYGIRWDPEPSLFASTSPIFPDPSRLPPPGRAQRLRYAGHYVPVQFPDLEHIVIDRLNGTNRQQITVNFESIITAGDCSKNTSLQWGDVVEIASVDHPLNEQWSGLPSTTEATLANCLQRTVQIVIKGQTNEVKLQPRTGGPPGQERIIHACDLNSVVTQCNLLLISSDLSGIKVLRAGEPPREVSLATSLPPFILHDGDVIYIPEK